MESKINWRFDYGHNKRNTSSKNLQLEPGEITGITTQERPIRQYNSIYSDNNTSCSMFNTQPLDKSINVYNQRIFYSNLKTNGENIDSW
nr:MAG TPA: Xin repeat protein [Bacteriophage sp.]